MIDGKAQNDLERAVDRFFVNQSIMNVGSYLLGGKERRREDDLLEYLTQDSLSSRIKQGVSVASWLHRPAKLGLAKLLST
jgi:hypothetical protein